MIFFFLSKHLLSDDYENTALFHMPASQTSGLLLGSADPCWQPPGIQSSISDQGPSMIQHRGPGCDRQNRKHFGELIRAGIHADCTRTLEFFIDRPAEPTFSQERNNLHAVEVRVLKRLEVCQLSRHAPKDAFL